MEGNIIFTHGDTEIEYVITNNGVRIIKSYLVTDKHIKQSFAKHLHNKGLLTNRSVNSLVREWTAHNVLYKWGLFKSHTEDTDLDVKESWFRRLCYFFLTLFFRD